MVTFAAIGAAGSLFFGSGAAMAAQTAGAGGAKVRVPGPPICTIFGTPHNDVLRGTPGRNVICGFGGDDVLLGLGGDDILIGGPGRDVLVGGTGRDQLWGGSGDDLLIDTSDVSVENGDSGRDRCVGVVRTNFQGCEHVIRLRQRG